MDNTDGRGAVGVVTSPKLRSGCSSRMPAGCWPSAEVLLGRPLVLRIMSAGNRGGVRSAMVRLTGVEIVVGAEVAEMLS